MIRSIAIVLGMFTGITAIGADLAPERERGRFSILGDALTTFAMDKESKYAILAFNSGQVCVFPTDQKMVHLIGFNAHKKGVSVAIFGPEQKTFLTCSADGKLIKWDTLSARKHHQHCEEYGVNSSSAPAPQAIWSANAHSSAVTSMALSPDFKKIVTGASDGNLRTWDFETGKEIEFLKAAHPGGVKSVAFSPDGKLFATAGADKIVKLWENAEKAAVIAKLEGHEGAINVIAFSPDGKQLAAGTGIAKKSGSTHIWNVESKTELFKLGSHEDVVTCILYHPKTPHIATGGADKRVRFWDLNEKKELCYDAHAEPLRAMVLSSDGIRLGTCTERTARWFLGFGK